jgi:hypothetical protein
MNPTLRKWAIPFIALCFFACQKQIDKSPETSKIKSQDLGRAGIVEAAAATACGTPMTKTVFDDQGLFQMGVVSISNDENNIYVTINATAGTVITRVGYAAGTEDHVRDAFTLPNFYYTACNGPKTPDAVLSYPIASASGSVTITLPNSAFPADNCIWLGLQVTTIKPDGTGSHCGYVSEYDEIFGSAQFQSGFKYCKQDCPPPPPPPSCGQLRTQTPGGWGAEPNGNNPGTYLHNNFNAAFGSLTIGCYPNNYYIKLTSAQAITNLLPTGGTAAKLTSNMTDPASIKNVLVGHLVAVTLAVGFDNYDPNFGQAGASLGSMKISQGAFVN